MNTTTATQDPNPFSPQTTKWRLPSSAPEDPLDWPWDDRGDEPTEDPSPVAGAQLTFEKIRALMREAVLLPCKRGEKKCFEKGWQKRSRDDMADPAYLNRLKNSVNLGVLLGEPSGGIVTIDVDDDDALDEFLALNPKLCPSLRTKGKRGGNIWIKLTGPCPQLFEIKTQEGKHWGEFRSTGGLTIIKGVHPEGHQYRAIVEAPLVEIKFEEINFPDNLVLPSHEAEDAGDLPDVFNELVERHGEPVHFRRDRSGKLVPSSLNEAFWAGKYFAENLVVFDFDSRAFYQYDDASGLFLPITEDRIRQEISRDILDASRNVEGLKGIEQFRSHRVLKDIVGQLRGIAEERGFFANRPSAIHLANTMLEAANDRLVPAAFSPRFRSRCASPIAFDPNARCDRFINELLAPAISPDDLVLVQKYVGMCLLGSNIIQRLMMLHGLGGHGKSQIAEIIQLIIGVSNVTELRTTHLTGRFEGFRLRGKSLLVGNDVDTGFFEVAGASVVKGLIGGDRFDAEEKGGTGSFQFQGNFNVVVTANTRLRVRLDGDEEAWRRRLIVVPVQRSSPPKKIPEFGKKLVEDEGPGIVNWGIAGLEMLLRDVAETGDIRLGDQQHAAVAAMLQESDGLRRFLTESLAAMPARAVTTNDLTNSYLQFCAARGWRPLSELQFQKEVRLLMSELFGAVPSHSIFSNGRQVRGFRGVDFSNPHPTP